MTNTREMSKKKKKRQPKWRKTRKSTIKSKRGTRMSTTQILFNKTFKALKK